MPRGSCDRIAARVAGVGLLVAIASATAAHAEIQTFANLDGIIIEPVSKATPSPSIILVSGMRGPVMKVRVILNDLAHTFTADIEMTLVGPAGQSLIMMSDLGGSTDITGVDIGFDDAAAAGIQLGDCAHERTLQADERRDTMASLSAARAGGPERLHARGHSPATRRHLIAFRGRAPRGPFRRITAQQAQRFDERGFCVVEDALAPERLRRGRRGDRSVGGEGRGASCAGRDEEAVHRARRRDHLHDASRAALGAAARVLRGPALQAISVHDLVGPDVRLYWDQAVYKKPGTKDDFPWHQDNGYTYVEPQSYLTCGSRSPTRRATTAARGSCRACTGAARCATG